MITSTSNARIKHVRSLYDKRVRLAEQQVPVEGLRLLEEVLRAGLRPTQVFYSPEAIAANPRATALLRQMPAAEQVAVGERVLAALAATATPQGIVAVVPLPPPAAAVEGQLALVLAGLQDPGNVGTILRTAEAASVRTVLATAGTVDPFGAKVLRAGMGAQFRLGLLWDRTWAEIEQLLAGRALLLATAAAGTVYHAVDWTQPAALIVGSEAWGAGPQAERLATQRVAIPMSGGVESLNAAVAAAVLLFEAARQQAE